MGDLDRAIVSPGRTALSWSAVGPLPSSTSAALAAMHAPDGRAAHLYFRFSIARVLGLVAAAQVTRG